MKNFMVRFYKTGVNILWMIGKLMKKYAVIIKLPSVQTENIKVSLTDSAGLKVR